MNECFPIRIVGIGSAQGDDAVGWEVARRLRRELPSQSAVEIHESDGGFRLLEILDGKGALLLIDAVMSNRLPGDIIRITWSSPEMEYVRGATTHDLPIAEALELAECLGLLPDHVVLFGVEIAKISPAPGLTPIIAAAVPKLVRQLHDELSNLNRPSPSPGDGNTPPPSGRVKHKME